VSRFEGSPKHREGDTPESSRAPKDGQAALANSVQVKTTSPRRVGIDAENREIVVLDQTVEGVFHGHVRSWDELTDHQRNALIRAGLTDKRGNIMEPEDRS
jgi:hypothetical protein